MSDWIVNTVETFGYWGVALLMFAENIIPPIPSELIMPLAGFTVVRGKMTFLGVLLSGSLGALAGGTVWYYIGHFVGLERLKVWADKYGKLLTLSSKEIERAHQWFERWGGTAVFVCRFVPGVRTFISIPAGFSGMPLLPFLLYSFAGTLVWTALLAWLGMLLGQNYELVEEYLGPIGLAIVASLGVWFIVWVIRRKKRAAADIGSREPAETTSDR